MKRSVSIFLSVLLAATLILSACGTASAEMRVTLVRTGDRGASLRDKPNGEKIGSVHGNTDLPVYAHANGWFYVQDGMQTGWVSKNMVIIVSVENTDDVSTTPSVTRVPDSTVPYIANMVYGLNAKNETVRWVQNMMKATGIWYQGDEWKVTGNLGKHTMQEISSFMESRGYFGHSGVIDQNVINELYYYLYGDSGD